MKAKPVIIELVILTITAVIVCWFLGVFSDVKYDINLHDTYFVLIGRIIALPVLCFLIFVVYLAKEGFYRYRRRFQNIILLLSTFCINILLLIGFNFARQLTAEIKPSQNGWTIYPPLSALPKVPANVPLTLPFEYFFNVFMYTQIFFLLLLVIVAVVTGKNWNPNKNVSC